MDYFVGLDVSLRSVAVCVIDGDGRTVLERSVACEIEDISGCLSGLPVSDLRIGFEAEAMSQHLFFGLQSAGFDVVCMEARQVNAALSAMRNKAADELDWRLQTIDARGDVDATRTALAELLSSPPDGLILGGFNATDHTEVLEKLAAGGTTILGWHAAAEPGPIAGTPVFSNITTDPMAVAQVAAAYAIEATDHQAGVVIFTDTRFGIAVAKSDEMAQVIESCATCKVLDIVDMPLDQTSARMKQVEPALRAFVEGPQSLSALIT